MPASGKSTVGVLLAKSLKCQFVDSDLEIQRRESALLREILTSRGFLELRAIEEKVLLNIPLQNSVLATGGSAIYSAKAMKRLKAETDVVYLKTPLELIKARVGDFLQRGIAAPENSTIESLAAERTDLYEKYADLEVCTSEKNPSTISEEIMEKLFS